MIVYLIFIIVGLLLFIGAVARMISKFQFLRNAERAIGTLVRLVEKTDDEGTVYYPVFEIPTQNNDTITYSMSVGFSHPNWQVGQTASFIFESGKPETVRFLKYWNVFGGSLILLALALDLLVIGGGYFLCKGYFGI